MDLIRVLNEEQKKLAEDNHNLIYKYMNTKGLSTNDTEDWYGVLAEALCKAAATFDETRGVKFSTYAFACMDNECGHARISGSSIPDVEVLSLEYEMPNSNGCTLKDLLEDPFDFTEEVEFDDALQRVTAGMREEDVKVVKMLSADGLSCVEAAERIGVTKQRISAIQKKFISNLYKQLR